MRKGKYRAGFAEKFLGRVPSAIARALRWLHAVSVGEVNLLAPLLAEIRAPAARLGMRHLDDHADRLRAGQEEIRRSPGLLLPA